MENESKQRLNLLKSRYNLTGEKIHLDSLKQYSHVTSHSLPPSPFFPFLRFSFLLLFLLFYSTKNNNNNNGVDDPRRVTKKTNYKIKIF